MSTASVGRLAVVVIALISTLLLAQGAAMAGTVTFMDLTDTITLSDDTGRTSGFTCTGESCSVLLDGPAGATGFTPSDLVVGFTEPGTNVLSDSFSLIDPPPVQVELSFISDTDPGSLGTCPEFATCPAETGLAQTVLTITWMNGTGGVLAVDTIKVQSDVSEPASVLLLLTGLGVVAIAKRRAHRKTNP